MTSSGKDVVPVSAEDVQLQNVVNALRGNTFGILADDGSIEDKVVRLLNLLPMAFQVMDEARETIARLRSQIEASSEHTESDSSG